MYNLPQFLERAGTAVKISAETGRSVKDVLVDMAQKEAEEERKAKEEQARQMQQLLQDMTNPYGGAML